MLADTSNIVLTHGGTALAIVGLIEWLKRFAWVRGSITFICRSVSFLAAVAVHIGITLSLTPTNGGGWDIGGHIPSIGALVAALFQVMMQFFYQEGTYQVYSGVKALQTIAAAHK